MLADLQDHLAQLVAKVPAEDLPTVAAVLEEARVKVWVRLAGRPAPPATPQAAEGNISVEEAARRIGMSRAWIYKNASSLPFVVRFGRRVVCSARELERWSRPHSRR